MNPQRKDARRQPGVGTSQNFQRHNITVNHVAEARQRLRDAIIAVGLPYASGIALFAAADSYARAMRDADKVGAS